MFEKKIPKIRHLQSLIFNLQAMHSMGHDSQEACRAPVFFQKVFLSVASQREPPNYFLELTDIVHLVCFLSDNAHGYISILFLKLREIGIAVGRENHLGWKLLTGSGIQVQK